MELKKLLNNPTVLTWSASFVNMLLPVMILPYAKIKLNSYDFAFFLYILNLINITFIIDVGLGATLTRKYSEFVSGKNIRFDKKELNWIASRFFNIISVLGLILLLIIWTLGSKGFGQNKNLYLNVFLACIIVYSRLRSFKYTAQINGTGNISKTKKVEIVVGIFQAMALFIVLNVYSSVTSILFTYVFSYLLLYQLLKKIADNEKNKIKIFNNKILSDEILRPSIRLGAISISAVLITNAVSIFVGNLNNLELVGKYLFANRLYTVIVTFIAVTMASLLPRVVRSFVTGNLEDNKKISSELAAFAFVMCLTSCVVMISVNELNALLGLGENIFPSQKVLIIMAIITFLEIQQSIHSAIYIQTNDIPFVVSNFISMVLFIYFAWYFSNKNQFNEMLMAQLAVLLLINSWFPVYKNLKLLRYSFSSYVKDTIIEIFKFGIVKRVLRNDNV
ncbi:MAG: hypothetical protein L6Q33_07275 [Bacteriovoracaceae bacterium]|nr:hypothetical protein [Bacteriovoracaceae bacterium]